MQDAYTISFDKLCKEVQLEEIVHHQLVLKLPDITVFSDEFAEPDLVSIKILQMFHPILLTEYTPSSVIGDGSCFFRSLCMGLFGMD